MSSEMDPGILNQGDEYCREKAKRLLSTPSLTLTTLKGDK